MDLQLPTERDPESLHLVALDADHPGFRDPSYRRRRDDIARLANSHRIGDRPPHVDYTAAEQLVWSAIWRELQPLHQKFVCSDVLELLGRIRFEAGPIPQLAEVDRLLRVATGFSMQPVAGLVAARDFLTALADRVFLSTQYIRHSSAPFYTPEPDIVHELVGHATTLVDPRFADLHAAFGRAASHASPARLAAIERVYWFTVEYGVVRENGEPKAAGAGLLSSLEELSQLESGPELASWDLDVLSARPYDPTRLQPVLFVAPSFDVMIRDTTAWLKAVAS